MRGGGRGYGPVGWEPPVAPGGACAAACRVQSRSPKSDGFAVHVPLSGLIDLEGDTCPLPSLPARVPATRGHFLGSALAAGTRPRLSSGKPDERGVAGEVSG